MKLLKNFLYISILIDSLFFFVELDSMNFVGDVSDLDPNTSIKIQIPFLVENPSFEKGFEVWVVLLGTLSLGVVVGFLMALFQIVSQKSDLIKNRSKLKRIQLELDTLRNQAIDDDIEISDILDDEQNTQLDEFEVK